MKRYTNGDSWTKDYDLGQTGPTVTEARPDPRRFVPRPSKLREVAGHIQSRPRKLVSLQGEQREHQFPQDVVLRRVERGTREERLALTVKWLEAQKRVVKRKAAKRKVTRRKRGEVAEHVYVAEPDGARLHYERETMRAEIRAQAEIIS